ncbi:MULTISPECIES: hypothetical protein [Phyllobacteriaceae]|nr:MULTISPECIES: hypothetical protein [unclassified Mesorhizobium]MBN9236349.1 ATP-dependent Zn protease [Mesorhizobium sp.]
MPTHMIDGDSQAVLHTLARQASGLTGADVERIVREARQNARRERRRLSFGDLQARLAATKPVRPESLRRRMAIHEAGHVVAHMALGTARIDTVTIDGPHGGHVEGETYSLVAQTEAGINAQIVTKLAGRAAEEELLGSVSAGAGGSPRSDLSLATDLALAMETTLGFSKQMPLLHRQTKAKFAQLVDGTELAIRVNDRLEYAYRQARELIRCHRPSVQMIADALLTVGTLDGDELAALMSDSGNENAES